MAIRKLHPLRSVLSLAALAALTPPGALAQTAAAPTTATTTATTTAPPTTAGTDTALTTIEVTGQGRRQRLQNVPISETVVTADDIAKLGAANLGDMNGSIPGLVVVNDQPTQPFFSVRGIGTGDFGIGTDAPVGVYVNGVYTGKTGGALMNFNDVRRIEVLRGPQGTLFGRNSAGGAIAVVTNDPSGERLARGSLRLGEHGLVQADAVADTALGDDLALRVSAVARRSDGWLRDAASGERSGGDDAWGSRLALRWSASDATSAVLSWEHEKLDQRARPAIGILATPGQAVFDPHNPGTVLDPRRAPLLNDAEGNREQRDFDGLTLRINHSLAIGELSSTTAWRHFRSFNRQDNDGSNRIASYLSTANIEANTSWQQEFRLAGKSAAVDWLAGASFFAERADQTSRVNSKTDTLDTMFGLNPAVGLPVYAMLSAAAGDAGIPGINLLGQDWQEDMVNSGRYRSLALYGDTIWHLDPATNLTTGLRFTRDHKRFSWRVPPRLAAGVDQQLAQLAALGFIDALPAELQALLAMPNVLFDAGGTSAAALQRERSWNDFSPRLVLDHRLSPDLMIYGSLSRGYQSGGFNALQVNGAFEPERVTSLELGAKGQWPAQGLSYSAALFHYRFSNLQSLSFVQSDATTGIPTYQVTSSDQAALGLDLEARWQPRAGLRLFGAAELIDQTYKHHVANSGRDLSGQPVGTPRLTAAGGIDLQWAAVGGRANLTLQGRYTGATRCNDDAVDQGDCLVTSAFTVGGARHEFDARLAWDSADGRWGVGLLVNNLTNRRYVTGLGYTAASIGAPYATVNRPRSSSIEFRLAL